MREWAERALSTARPLGDRPLTAAAVAALAFASAASGANAGGRERSRSEAAALVADLADDELALRLDAAANLAGAELYLDRYERGGRPRRASAWPSAARRGRASSSRSRTRSSVRSSCCADGWPKPAELLDDAVEGARLSGNVQALAGNLVNRSLAALAAGDVEMALATARGERRADAAGSIRASSARPGWRWPPRSSRPATRARRRRPSSRPRGGDELPLIPGGWRAKCARAANPLLARARPARRGRARRRLRRGHGRGAAAPMASVDGRSRRRGGRARRRRPDRAAERALASAAAADEVGAPVEAALARTLAGRALAQAGQRRAGGRRAAARRRRAPGLRRDRYRDAAERELRRLGHRIHRRTRPGKAERDRRRRR